MHSFRPLTFAIFREADFGTKSPSNSIIELDDAALKRKKLILLLRVTADREEK